MDTKLSVVDVVTSTAYLLLRRVFRILRGCGLKSAQLQAMSVRAIAEIERLPDSNSSRVTARQAIMCSDVVLKWRRDCGFLDASGLPMQLSLQSSSPSFSQLVEKAAPGADAQQLVKTMEELGVIRFAENRKIELISESVVTCSGREGSAIASECVLEHICGFLGSVEYNVFDKPSREKGRFERACYATVPRNLAPILEQLVSNRGQDFVDVIDEWLARRAITTVAAEDSILVGAGAYVFVRQNVK